MKLFSIFAGGVLLTAVASAQTSFPGIQSVLTGAEWKRAGLDKLSPDQIGVIDAALIVHYRENLMKVTVNAATTAKQEAIVEATTPKRSIWDGFGLLRSDGPDWRSVPPLIVRVIGWQSPSRFVLENGQIWEGIERIPYELVDKEVTIEARPNDQFALKLGERSAVVRVRRVK